MPQFDSTPPTDLGRSGFRLIRTPSATPIFGHIISDNLVGCRTHFVGQRTVPCESPNCDSCDTGIAWRWHGYVLLVIDATQEVVIFECTARSSQAIAAYYQRYSTTRGAHMKAMRSPAKPNGRVLIQCKPADLEKITLPKAPPVEKLLCHIWNLSENQIGTTDNQPRPPFASVTIQRNKTEVIQHIKNAAALVEANPEGNGNGRKELDANRV